MRQVFLASVMFLALSAPNSHAETINNAEQYKACMTLVHRAADEAFDAGLTWKGLGGGEAAEHCIATALIAMKRYKFGSERLEKLADRSRRPKEFKAKILAQAAQGWFLANELDHARAVITTAISLDENQSDFYVDRAQMRSAQQAYKEALEDLSKALSLDGMNVDALVFRGTIYRLTENFEDAYKDITQALALEPGNAEALLERGMLHRIEGKDAFARHDWLEVLEINPNGQTAETARLNLEKMDVKHQEK